MIIARFRDDSGIVAYGEGITVEQAYSDMCENYEQVSSDFVDPNEVTFWNATKMKIKADMKVDFKEY
jgi:hypothetical protein